jgi:hypothetical protein
MGLCATKAGLRAEAKKTTNGGDGGRSEVFEGIILESVLERLEGDW